VCHLDNINKFEEHKQNKKEKRRNRNKKENKDRKRNTVVVIKAYCHYDIKIVALEASSRVYKDRLKIQSSTHNNLQMKRIRY
jgi:hypothetical protein